LERTKPVLIWLYEIIACRLQQLRLCTYKWQQYWINLIIHSGSICTVVADWSTVNLLLIEDRIFLIFFYFIFFWTFKNFSRIFFSTEIIFSNWISSFKWPKANCWSKTRYVAKSLIWSKIKNNQRNSEWSMVGQCFCIW